MKIIKFVACVLFICVLFLFISYSAVLWERLSSGQAVSASRLWMHKNFAKEPNKNVETKAVKIVCTTTTIPKPTPSSTIKIMKGRPRFQNMDDAILELDTDMYSCNDPASTECAFRTERFGDLMKKELRRITTRDGKAYRLKPENNYDVKYDGSYGERGRLELLCAVAAIGVHTVTAHDEPFASLGFPIPAAPLHQGRTYHSCAVVSSAGALLGSKLGSFIDSHDMVVRFNNAPTEGYTEDVGSKTTFRILNSQVVAKPEYQFIEDPLYSNISLMIWDPANYTSTLEDWYLSPDHPMFDNYKKFLQLNPGADVHVLHPHVLWDLWSVLQMSAPDRIRKNPPSSGFLGIWFAMQRCVNVRVFEYVPSTRSTARCHYYSEHKNRECSLGTWHPLAQEKSVVNQMRDNTDFEAYQRGFVHVPGQVAYTCPG